MADIRELLRSELASRRTTDSRISSNTGTRVIKKRKLDRDEDLVRKRTKPAKEDLPLQAEVGEQIVGRKEIGLDTATADTSLVLKTNSAPALLATTNTIIESSTLDTATQAVDEDEWAAFEREVAAPTRIPPTAVTVLSTAATISAAPISATELAVRDQQETPSRSMTRELEALGEHEDAARYLEEEFDEMDQLEERVKRLKEKREDIRRRRLTRDDVDNDVGVDFADQHLDDDQPGYEGEAESEEDDEGDDDWDTWRLR
jgi:hypothetical protein